MRCLYLDEIYFEMSSYLLRNYLHMMNFIDFVVESEFLLFFLIESLFEKVSLDRNVRLGPVWISLGFVL